MVDDKLFDVFSQHSVDKQFEIEYSGGVITNSELSFDGIELTESLCSENELVFGSCEASSIKFQIANVFIPMAGQEITVRVKLEGNHDRPFQIGKYKVASDKPTADRRYRDIIAYDAMVDILDADVKDWYNKTLPDSNSKMTMKAFRTSFLKHFNIAEANSSIVLANDSMAINRTVEPEQLSGKDVINAICEINGCFGHINREGKFAYIYLPQYIQGLYPANDLYPDHAPDYLPYMQEKGHLYPKDPIGAPIGRNGTYISCDYEDFLTKEIKMVHIRQQENEISGSYGSEGNAYVISGNFLVYNKGQTELEKIAQNIQEKIGGVIYRPFSAEIQGNPCFEVGDPVRLSTQYKVVESYILNRTLKGAQSLRDSFSADGVLEYTERLNSVQTSLVQLRGKTNELTRNIDETKSELKDTEKSLRSTITQTAGEIRAEVANADANLQSQITQNAGEIDMRVRKDNIISSINLTPEKITIEAQKIDLKGLVNADELVSKFATITTLNATKATLENLIATKATITDLNATKANLENLIATKATITDLNAVSARLGTVEANYISTSTVAATYATIQSLNAVNAKFNNLNANNITSGKLSVSRLDAGGDRTPSWTQVWVANGEGTAPPQVTVTDKQGNTLYGSIGNLSRILVLKGSG